MSSKKSKPPKLASFEKPKSAETIQIVENFLTQLAEQIGRNNVYEIVKMKKTKAGWNALTRINSDLYTFKLDANGNVLSYEDLSSQ